MKKQLMMKARHACAPLLIAALLSACGGGQNSTDPAAAPGAGPLAAAGVELPALDGPTAATIAPIAEIGLRGERFALPPVETRTLSTRIKAYLDGIKSGAIADELGWCVEV